MKILSLLILLIVLVAPFHCSFSMEDDEITILSNSLESLTIEPLPKEITVIVINFLNLRDLCILASANKAFYKALKPFIKKQISKHISIIMNNKKLYSSFINSALRTYQEASKTLSKAKQEDLYATLHSTIQKICLNKTHDSDAICEIVELVRKGANPRGYHGEKYNWESPISLVIKEERIILVGLLLSLGECFINLAGGEPSTLRSAHTYCTLCFNEEIFHYQREGALNALFTMIKALPNFALNKSTEPSSLHQAASLGNLEMVKQLLAHGAFIDSEDNMGRMPLNYSAEKGQVKVNIYLQEKGAHMKHI